MPEYTPEDAKNAVDELRTKMKKYGEDSHEYKAAVEYTEAALNAQEEKNQEFIRKQALAEKATEEMEEQIKTLELELARGGSGKKVDYKEGDDYKAVLKYVTEGEKGMTQEDFTTLKGIEKKTLRTDVDTGAGYLVIPEFDTMITKTITEISQMRSVARVRSTSKKVLDMPIRTSVPTATYEGEAAEGNASQSVYGSEQLTSFRLTVTVPFTQDMLMDSSFNFEAEVNGDVAEGMAYKEGNKFVLGTGAKQPEGFLVNAVVVAAATTSEASGAVSAKDLTDMTGELKVGYDPMYGFNRKSLAAFRSLEDGAGRPIWQLDMSQKAPNLINGEPYILLPDMPDIAANSLSVVYADFKRGYTITDRTGMMVIRDDITRKKEAIIEITFHKWNTGQVTLAEAFHILKTKA